MAKLLFRLNQVEEDEANEVRDLLQQAEIEFYETDAGRWRISVAAIWLRHDEDFERARALLDDYQQQRRERLQQQAENIQTFWQRAQERPADLLLAVLAIAVVLGLMIWPFFSVGE